MEAYSSFSGSSGDVPVGPPTNVPSTPPPPSRKDKGEGEGEVRLQSELRKLVTNATGLKALPASRKRQSRPVRNLDFFQAAAAGKKKKAAAAAKRRKLDACSSWRSSRSPSSHSISRTALPGLSFQGSPPPRAAPPLAPPAASTASVSFAVVEEAGRSKGRLEQAGHAEALLVYELAQQYLMSEDNENSLQAVQFELACADPRHGVGLAEAEWDVAARYLFTHNDEVIKKRDPVKGVQYLQRAADQGHPQAQYQLAVQYRCAEGLPQYSEHYRLKHKETSSESQARARQYAQLFLQSAKGGCVLGMLTVAWCLLRGEGTQQNIDLAAQWLEKALEQAPPQGGHPPHVRTCRRKVFGCLLWLLLAEETGTQAGGRVVAVGASVGSWLAHRACGTYLLRYAEEAAECEEEGEEEEEEGGCPFPSSAAGCLPMALEQFNASNEVLQCWLQGGRRRAAAVAAAASTSLWSSETLTLAMERNTKDISVVARALRGALTGRGGARGGRRAVKKQGGGGGEIGQ